MSESPPTETALFLPQLSEQDVPALAAQGVRLIVNNRPEEELPSTPGEVMARACAAAGIDYLAAPVRRWPEDGDVEAVAGRLAQLKDDEAAALYCRSGGRSALMWALAQARLGRLTAEEIRAVAARAGFDLSGLPL